MDEEAKRRIAQFRFGVIHDLIGDRKLNRGEQKRLLLEKSSSTWEIPGSERSFISVSTILLWARRYEKGGRRIESLYPDGRSDRGRPRALDEETIISLVELRKQLKGHRFRLFCGRQNSGRSSTRASRCIPLPSTACSNNEA